MLANNKECKLLLQEMAFMQEQIYREFMNGTHESIIATAQQMFNRNKEMEKKYSFEAFQTLVRAEILNPEDISGRQFELAMFGVAMSTLYMVYTIGAEGESDKIELYTSSYQVLNSLATSGSLISKKEALPVELNKFKLHLTDSKKISKALKDGMKVPAVRLEPHIVGSDTKFKGQIPKTPIDLNRCFVIPVKVVDICMGLVNNLLQSNLMRVIQGDKVRVVTKDLNILKSIYKEDRAKKLVNFIHNPLTNTFYVPSVGASIHTAGVTNINLMTLDAIQPATLGEVDLTDLNVDLTLARGFYEKSVRKMKQLELKKLSGVLGIDITGDTVPAMKYKCLSIEKYDQEYYVLMKENKDIFKVDEFRALPNKLGSLYDDVPIPLNKDELKELMGTGIFKVVITKRTGGLSTMIVTNSRQELEKMYGRSYIGKYESLRVRITRIREILAKYKGDIVSVKDLEKIEKLFRVDIPLDIAIPKTSLLEFLLAKENMIEQRKTVVNNPEYVRVKNCVARIDKDGNPKDFYKQIDLRSVVSITRLSDITKKEVK